MTHEKPADLRAIAAHLRRAREEVARLSEPLPFEELTIEDFRRWRREVGLTAADAAAVVGVSAHAVRAWERRKSPNTFPALAGRLVWVLRRHPALVDDLRAGARSGARKKQAGEKSGNRPE